LVETHGRASLHEIYERKKDYGEAGCLAETHGRASLHEIYGNTVDYREAGCLLETHGRASVHEILWEHGRLWRGRVFDRDARPCVST
jgi:hypothetical protein